MFYSSLSHIYVFESPRVNTNLRIFIVDLLGVRSYREQHQEAEPGRAAHLQQTPQPFFLPVGSGHHLQEEDDGAPFHQSGKPPPAVWTELPFLEHRALFTALCCRCLSTGWNRRKSRWHACLKTLPVRNL